MGRTQTIVKFCTILVVLLEMGRSTTASPTWAGTGYIQAGFKIIVLNGAHQNGGNLYTYTYSPAFSTTPYTALGLIGFETSNLNEYKIKLKINIPNYTSTTSLQISMIYPTSTTWRQFRASYIAIDAVFSQVRVDYLQLSTFTNVVTGVGPRTYTGVFTLNIGAVNINHKISIIPLLIGIESHSVNGEHMFYWDTKLRNANSITYNLTADRTTHIFELVSYILVVDRTNAENYLEIFMDELYIGGTNNSPVYQAPVYYNLTNMHAGLNSGSFYLPAINFDKSSFLLSSLGYYTFLNMSVWSYRERTCPLSQPYYELNTNLCYDTCPPGYVNSVGTTKRYCKSCGDFITACLQCSATGSSCVLCAGNYVVSGSSCVCPTGYYVSASYTQYADKCRACHLACLTCSGPNQNNCLSCVADRTLSNSECVCPYGTTPTGVCFASSCSDPSCTQCNSNLCQACLQGFILEGARCTCPVQNYLDLNTISCQPCHYSCMYCSGSSSTSCTKCDRTNSNRYLSQTNSCLCVQGYTEVNNTCVQANSQCTEPGYMVDPVTSACIEICGDGNRINYACDDGNMDDGDGCSTNCTIQSGFVCSENVLAPNKRSFCSYTQPIQMILNSTTKDIYSNMISMNFTLSPTLMNILTSYSDLTNYISIVSPPNLTIDSANFDLNTKLLLLKFSYDTTLQAQPISIRLTMPETALSYAIPVSTVSCQIQAENKLIATPHSPLVYFWVNIFKIMGTVSYTGGLALFILLMFFRKMIGLDYIIMLQFVYFSLMLSKYEHAYLGPAQEWEFINGYNKISANIPTAKLADSHFWVLGYYDYFYINCNAMLFVCLVNYAFALVLYALSVASDRSVSRKLKTSAQYFAVDIGFALAVFSLNNIVVSLFLEIEAGHILKFQYGLNKFFLIIAVIMFLGQVGAYFMKIHDVLDSQLFYHRNKNYTHFYPFIFLVRNLVLIIFIILAQKIGKVSSYITLGMQGAYILIVLIGRPYKRYIDYARFLVVELTLALLLVCRFIQANVVTSFTSIDIGIAKFIEISSMIVMMGAAFGLFMSLATFGFHLWKGRTQDGQVAPEQQGEDLDMNPPPINFSNSQQKFQLREEEKSKELMILDVQEEDVGATDYPVQSIFNQSSKRKLKGKPISKRSKQYY